MVWHHRCLFCLLKTEYFQMQYEPGLMLPSHRATQDKTTWVLCIHQRKQKQVPHSGFSVHTENVHKTGWIERYIPSPLLIPLFFLFIYPSHSLSPLPVLKLISFYLFSLFSVLHLSLSLCLPLCLHPLPPPSSLLPLSLPLLHLAEAKCLVWDNITVGNSACVARLLSFLPRAGNNVRPS